MGLTRRDILRYGVGAGATAIASASLGGCSRFEATRLKLAVLEGSIPIQLAKRFRSQTGGDGKTQFVPTAQPSESFQQLQRWARDPASLPQSWRSRISNPLGRSPRPADLISLGDGWLTAAIRQDLIQPLDYSELPRWAELSGRWQQLVQRNGEGFLQADGPVWAAPYRWGSMVIAYRKNRLAKLDFEITDWADLWRPELKGLVSLPDSPRDVIGLTLKRLSQSYNHPNPSQVEGLAPALGNLQGQVKLYDSQNYLQPLLLEDTWVAVGSSAELLPLLQRDRNLALISPASGTALWADLWVKPKPFTAPAPAAPDPTATAPEPNRPNDTAALAARWIDFCWTPETVQLITSLSHGASPLALQPGLTWLEKLQNRKIVLPEATLATSEFILPLAQASLDEYEQLWVALRRGELG
ncbi:MAG: extracellular solute-binding protein [Synechococcales cyanobacterium RM1_1_8]|nr:extracellular solute-binding protein [Synechococcales cyanobacterium RM1_1_8]